MLSQIILRLSIIYFSINMAAPTTTTHSFIQNNNVYTYTETRDSNNDIIGLTLPTRVVQPSELGAGTALVPPPAPRIQRTITGLHSGILQHRLSDHPIYQLTIHRTNENTYNATTGELESPTDSEDSFQGDLILHRTGTEFHGPDRILRTGAIVHSSDYWFIQPNLPGLSVSAIDESDNEDDDITLTRRTDTVQPK